MTQTTFKVSAEDLATGTRFAYGTHSYTVESKVIDTDHIDIYTVGGRYPMGFFFDSPVCEIMVDVYSGRVE